ncbi:MAG: hypothetical protein LAO20_20005 [Acidobacteriia bacterium]|nr:hypothetical protein [Terriglobia bacterium]
MFKYLNSKFTQNATLFALLLVWIVSFFLPALEDNGPWFGYRAAYGSMVLFVGMVLALFRGAFGDVEAVPLFYGLLWIANVFMLASPWMLRRSRRGQGQVCIALLTVWDVLILATLWVLPAKAAKPLERSPFLVGYFVWQTSVLGMTAYLWLVRQQAKRLAMAPLQDGSVSRETT